MAEQFLDFVLRYLPGYALVMAVMLIPLLVVIVTWRGMGFLVNRLGDRAIYAIQVKRRFKRMGERTTREELLNSLRALDPTEFEYYMASVFTNAGFKAKVMSSPGMPDGGIDITLSKDGSDYFVQCKKFIGKDIGVGLVRDFYGAIADQLHSDEKSKGYFMTTTYFTEAAKKFAKSRRLQLYDGDALMDIIFRQEGSGDRVDLGDYDRSFILRNIPPICPVCRRSLAWRKKDQDTFIGCTGYPQCHYVFSQSVKR